MFLLLVRRPTISTLPDTPLPDPTLFRSFDLPASDLVLGAIVGGYILQRIEEGIFIRCFKIQMHIWRPFDSRFRLITARRNPNLILLTLSVLIGRPDLGIIWVAVWRSEERRVGKGVCQYV